MWWPVCTEEMGILVGKPEEKRPLGRSRYRWDDNIKSEFKETAWGQ
jgi:hypothetical protein